MAEFELTGMTKLFVDNARKVWEAEGRYDSKGNYIGLKTQDSSNDSKDTRIEELEDKEITRTAKGKSLKARTESVNCSGGKVASSLPKNTPTSTSTGKYKYGITDEYNEEEYQGLLTRMYSRYIGKPMLIADEIFKKFEKRVNEKLILGEDIHYGTPISYCKDTDIFYISKQDKIDLILKGKYAKELGLE